MQLATNLDALAFGSRLNSLPATGTRCYAVIYKEADCAGGAILAVETIVPLCCRHEVEG